MLVAYNSGRIMLQIFLAGNIIDHADICTLLRATFISVMRAQYVENLIDYSLMYYTNDDEEFTVSDCAPFKGFAFYELLQIAFCRKCSRPHVEIHFLGKHGDNSEIFINECPSVRSAELAKKCETQFLLNYEDARKLLRILLS